jgi:hypothetical protein
MNEHYRTLVIDTLRQYYVIVIIARNILDIKDSPSFHHIRLEEGNIYILVCQFWIVSMVSARYNRKGTLSGIPKTGGCLVVFFSKTSDFVVGSVL